MSRRSLLTLIATAMILSACATTSAPPVRKAQGEDRFLIDPRTGFAGSTPESVERSFDDAWRQFIAGDYANARRRITSLRAKNPDYAPAALAEAAINIREGNVAAAKVIVDRIEQQTPDYMAARVYEAEIARAQNDTRRALEIYRSLAQQPGAPPTAAERSAQLEKKIFEELYAAAQTASDEEAARMLREALAINAGAADARVLLARKLLAQKNFDEARAQLDLLVNTTAGERDDVQELLAEIDAGRERYQDAIARYERLTRKAQSPRLTQRLNELKELWNAANMPPQYQRAVESEAISRADFAVLLYWKLSSVRFAQNLASPPIAVDVADIPGREEIIRAIAIGLFDVDSVTRRVFPLRNVTASNLMRMIGRILISRGASCARGATSSDVLSACAIIDPTIGVPPDTPVTGRMAAALLDQLERALR